jgi:hypothetical protein
MRLSCCPEYRGTYFFYSAIPLQIEKGCIKAFAGAMSRVPRKTLAEHTFFFNSALFITQSFYITHNSRLLFRRCKPEGGAPSG